MECLFQVGEEILPQVEEFKYLGVLFTSEGKMERGIDRRISAVSAVMRTRHRFAVVKREPGKVQDTLDGPSKVQFKRSNSVDF